jgi:hypothetical protein
MVFVVRYMIYLIRLASYDEINDFKIFMANKPTININIFLIHLILKMILHGGGLL